MSNKVQTTFERIVEDLLFLRDTQVEKLKRNQADAEDLARVMFNRTLDTLKVLWKEETRR